MALLTHAFGDTYEEFDTSLKENGLLFDINQIDKSLPKLLNMIKNDMDSLDITCQVADNNDEKLQKLEKEIVEAKHHLKESIEKYSSYKEQLTRLHSSSALSTNLINGLYYALDKICGLIKTNLEGVELNSLEEHLAMFNTSLRAIETIVCTSFDTKKRNLEKAVESHLIVIKSLFKSYQSIKEVSMVHICPICLSDPVASFIIPCGHTFCDKCIRKMKHTCFVCRQDIQRFSQLYFN